MDLACRPILPLQRCEQTLSRHIHPSIHPAILITKIRTLISTRPPDPYRTYIYEMSLPL